MEGQTQSQEARERKCWAWESLKGYHFTQGATFEKGDGLDEESHGRDEGKYDKDESCR